jgi:hypothetical protein
MTVERARMVQWWPLVDVGQLELRDGDTVILRAPAPLAAEGRAQLRAAWEQAFPAVKVILTNGALDFIVWRPMAEMRAEDLVQPVRASTME